MRQLMAAAAVAASMLAPLPAADRVDDYVRAEMKARKIPGLSLAIVQRGRVVKAAGCGRWSLRPTAA